ncbi:M16 family metallopeptidase [Corallococcus exercitus]|uniref:M16 family metallopeptidase n=1 Tax=Corallococcus exercitus TaxID=2316736 RepID=UPI0035D4520A
MHRPSLPRPVLLGLLLLTASPGFAASRGQAPSPPAAALAVTSEVLVDGTELLVVPQPASDTASLRVVVRSGASHDPPGKEGLAHLVEHLVFHGSQDLPGLELRARVEAAGGTLNAHTVSHATVYMLDAPAAAFVPLARDMLRMVTSPMLPGGKRLERELGIIQTESTYHFKDSLLGSQIEGALFSSVSAAYALIGSRNSRGRIAREDVLKFYASEYLTSNISLVFTGAVAEAEARRLVDEGYRLAPALAEERVAPALEAAVFPVEQETRAANTFVTLGYSLPHEARATCRAVAALLELRLLLAVHVKEPIVSGVEVRCLNLRGNDLLLAFAYTRSLDGSLLPSLMQETFDSLAKRPPAAAEQKLLAQRGRREVDGLSSAGPALADALASEAAEPRQEGGTDLGFLRPPPPLTPAVLKDFVRRHFVEERSVRIVSTPL